MELTPMAIDAYKQLLINPNEYGFFDYKPLKECFQESENITPKHLLYEAYVAYLRRPLPKVVFYIVMDEIYGDLIATDEETGCLGYKLKFII